MSGLGAPYKTFRVNNPTKGAWTYVILEDEAPVEPEPIRVYMANEADMILEVNTDRERYFVDEDASGNPLPVLVEITAELYQGGETSGFENHTSKVGAPITDALVVVKVTVPGEGDDAGQLLHQGDGIYTGSFVATELGSYDLVIVASDYIDDGNTSNYNNGEYVITAEHSIYVSPSEEVLDWTAKLHLLTAERILNDILNVYCPTNQSCTLDRKTKSAINKALAIFAPDKHDDDLYERYLETDINLYDGRPGYDFFDDITTIVNLIDALLEDPELGDDFTEVIFHLKEASYKLASFEIEIALDYCVVSNCDESFKNATEEHGKGVREYLKGNYVNSFNHFTNAWKHAQNMMGAKLRKDDIEITSNLPGEYDMEQNYPNPFNPSTVIKYQLPVNGSVKLEVFDMLGNSVAVLVDEEMTAGYHEMEWNAGGLASGVYFYRFISGNYAKTLKLMLLK
jgi:hypothetical protein